VLQQQITSQSKGHIKLVSFEITEVREFRTAGLPGRRISYAAEVEFDHSGLWSIGVGNKTLGFEFSPNNPLMAKGDIAEVMKDMQGNRQMCKGERSRFVGVMTGTKSENAWKYELDESHPAGG